MSAMWGQTMDSNDERDFETASSASAFRRPASRWAKTAGMASLVATMLLLGFVAGRATASGSTESALKRSVIGEVEVIKIRKPVVEGQCTAANGMCSASKCCQTTNYYCWQKSPGEAYCKEKCPAGWMCTELEGGDTIVPVAHDSDGVSLFCFSAYVKNRGVDDADDYNLDLLLTQFFERCPTFWEGLHGGSGCPSNLQDPSAMGATSAPHSLEKCVPFISVFSETGVQSARKILWCLSQLWWQEVEFCPLLPVLVSLLLLFSESEAIVYTIVHTLLCRASEEQRRRISLPNWEIPRPFPLLPFTRAQWSDAAEKAVGLARAEMPQEIGYLEKLGVDLNDTAATALAEGLASLLPFRAVCRAYGAFLSEGCQVFARLLVALWSHHRGLLKQAPSVEAARQLLLPPVVASGVLERSHAPDGRELLRTTSSDLDNLMSVASMVYGGLLIGVDELASKALAISIPTQLARLKSGPITASLADSSVIVDGRLCCRPRLLGEASNIVWDALWAYLWQWLPPLCTAKVPFLSFSSKRDGYNLSAVLSKCEKALPNTPMFLIVRAYAEGNSPSLLGVFLPGPLQRTGRGYIDIWNHPCLAAEVSYTFVFQAPGSEHETALLSPTAWHWTGQNDMLFDAPATDDALLIGGDSAAFRLDGALRSGATRTSASFASPPLLLGPGGSPGKESPTPSYVDYNVLDVEVFELRDG